LKNQLFLFETSWVEAVDKKEEVIAAKTLIDDIFFFEKNIRKPGKLLKRANSCDPHKYLRPTDCVKLNHSTS